MISVVSPHCSLWRPTGAWVMNLSGIPTPITGIRAPVEATYSLTSLNRPPLMAPSSRVRMHL